MHTQTIRRVKAGACLLLAATAFAGCARHQQPVSTSAQVQQAAQQQAAQRAAYFNSHPTNSAQPPTANPYRGHQ